MKRYQKITLLLAIVMLFAFAGIRAVYGSLDIVNQISSIRDIFALSFIGR